MTDYVVLDYETRSRCDLRKAGAWAYSQDPSTEILILTYSINGGITCAWLPGQGCPPPLAAVISQAQIWSHGSFDFCIYNNVQFPFYNEDGCWPIARNDQWRDIMASCAYKALPLKLEKAAEVLGLAHQKDTAGGRNMKRLAKPLKDGNFDDDLDRHERNYEYGLQDTTTEVALLKRVGPLPASEQRLWNLDQAINLRGVRVDLDLVAAAKRVCDTVEVELNAELSRITGGEIETSGQVAKIREYLSVRGLYLPNLQADTVEDTLQWVEMLPQARRVLEIRQTLSKASTKKLAALQLWAAHGDHRARYMLQYHGAATGRWAGRGPQPQNLPRPILKADPDTLVEDIMAGDIEYLTMIYGSPTQAVADVMRHVFIADEGRVFVSGDLSQVEARILAWYGREQWKLDAFKDIDAGLAQDIYCKTAEAVFGRPITKEDPERQIGKILELASGFQGWIGAWRGFDKSNNHSDGDVKRYMGGWRDNHPGVVEFWKALDSAAIRVISKGDPVRVNGCTFEVQPGFMTITVPGGGKLWYRDPHLVERPNRYDDTKMELRPAYWAWKMGRWQRIYGYGGLFCENIVQKTARDILVASMYRIEEQSDHPIVLTIHDENLTEPMQELADPDFIRDAMREPVPWLPGLPINASVWVGPRYKKD